MSEEWWLIATVLAVKPLQDGRQPR